MTFTSVAEANAKTAQFARLFDLFDRVASRRTRSPAEDTTEVISADDIASVPAEFAPVLKNVSTILSLRALRDEGRARRADAAYTSRTSRAAGALLAIPIARHPTSCLEATTENPENATFPIGERYPFTFKLMLHKLYDLDEWAEKVKSAVETSRSQFKPLAERVQSVVKDATSDIDEREEKWERRGSIRPVLGASAKFRSSSSTRHLHPTATHSKPETRRVLKKRCVGRRKSVNGPMSTGIWVYDAVVSATEVTGPRPALEIMLSRCWDASDVAEKRVRHRSLPLLEDARGTTRSKVKIALPLHQVEASRSAPPKRSTVLFSEPAEEIRKMRAAVKKRSVAPALASEPCRIAAAKRPLCV